MALIRPISSNNSDNGSVTIADYTSVDIPIKSTPKAFSLIWTSDIYLMDVVYDENYSTIATLNAHMDTREGSPAGAGLAVTTLGSEWRSVTITIGSNSIHIAGTNAQYTAVGSAIKYSIVY